ncbi:20S proteasome beta-type subunit [Nocardia brasiliensis NBRC 14402]|uniref:proteasome subunit beta n=1 Tax=Nocardia brasiliensis TaxID=37326 RepID=UPI0002E02911|nr:proteasome subunit beta [Nocardia brasiliensis]ASF08358.1 proteasome subunit beta [Nocardia brasiliensis]GAJ85599.1 20S proteasome beta-type subunit [Nocardia brasiliensis NBRC 14402]SUB41176.1 Proteasome subunit beta 2 precursor [Nocardia brasiliensis]
MADWFGEGHTSSSFSEYLQRNAPELLPSHRFGRASTAADIAPHGTTIVAVTYRGGVLLAGDRRGTMGHLLATRDMEKVFITDTYSAAGFAGTVGTAVEMIRLFAVELEHYEKIEGAPLTFEGKANRLSKMVRDNLPAAMQDLAVVPLLVGYDLDATDPDRAGRIFSYDVVGGRSEERFGYAAVGSGSLFAKSSLKKTHTRDIDADRALHIAVEALFDAADDDTATGGPDVVRGIYPRAVIVDAEGAQEIPESRLVDITRTLLATRSAERSTS